MVRLIFLLHKRLRHPITQCGSSVYHTETASSHKASRSWWCKYQSSASLLQLINYITISFYTTYYHDQIRCTLLGTRHFHILTRSPTIGLSPYFIVTCATLELCLSRSLRDLVVPSYSPHNSHTHKYPMGQCSAAEPHLQFTAEEPLSPCSVLDNSAIPGLPKATPRCFGIFSVPFVHLRVVSIFPG